MDIRTYLKMYLKLPFLKGKIVTERTEDVFDYNYSKLQRDGVRIVIFDMDDTLTDYLGEIPERSHKLFVSLKRRGIKSAVFSNSKQERTEQLTKILNPISVYNVLRSDKPHKAGYDEILKHTGLKPWQAAVFGDKVGSDMLGAFNAKIKHRVLVEPFSEVFGGRRHPIYERKLRCFEKALFL
ncbi:MAG: HAD family hydrolase [Candidatus Dojkabacteria bacterium]